MQFHGDLFAGIGPAPNVDGPVALQHHMAAEQTRKFDFAVRDVGSAGQQKGSGKHANQCVNTHRFILTHSAAGDAMIVGRMQHNPGFLKLVDDAKTRVRQIDIEGYKELVAGGEKHVLVDTREDNEWDKGHVQGAVHLSRGIIERDIETQYPDKGTPLVLYCGGGFRSALVADNLQKMGYTNAISLDGGWRALKDSG
jgi:rhodanese-related sulfurtransferase